MLELVALTQPGPFAARTIELGGYVGVRQEGRLVAMAGRRVAPTGWTEISAVCTHPDFRGRGYATRLMLEVLRGIRAEGRRGFLTVLDGNPAARLYESMGFVRAPAASSIATPRPRPLTAVVSRLVVQD